MLLFLFMTTSGSYPLQFSVACSYAFQTLTKEKSEEVFKYLANYNFAGWENSIIRPLAQAQLEKI